MAKVMVIDDDLPIIELLELILSVQGYEAVSLSDSSRALDKARQESPDLILLDLMMPGMDGWQVLEALRGDHELRRIPVVLLTARADVCEDVPDPTRFGLAGFVLKPFDFDSLSHAIRTGLSHLVAPTT